MNDNIRTQLHAFNQWLIPAIFVALMGVGGYIGVQTIVNGNEIARIGTNQNRVLATLDNVVAIVDLNSTKLDIHLLESGFGTKSNSIRHHQSGMSPCDKCHKREAFPTR
jgi:hypothetical protein